MIDNSIYLCYGSLNVAKCVVIMMLLCLWGKRSNPLNSLFQGYLKFKKIHPILKLYFFCYLW